MTKAPAEPAPRFRRPTPEDAVDVARELLDAGERVDMQAVARLLGVSRATVHRWFGTREELMQALFEHLAAEFRQEAQEQARGRGDDRAFDFVRRIADRTTAYAPLAVAASREPGIVLHVMLAENGPVHAEIVEALTELLGESRTPKELRRIAGPIDDFATTAIALHWATIVAGGRPDTRRYERLGRALLVAAER